MLINFTTVWNDYKMFHVNSVGKFNCLILKLYLKVVDIFSPLHIYMNQATV